MTLKEYCSKNSISAYSISKACSIPYSTVSDLLNGKTELSRVAFGTVCKIADFLQISLDELRKMCIKEQRLQMTPSYSIIIRNKRFYLQVDDSRLYLCRVSKLNSLDIDDIARWRAQEYFLEKKMKEVDQQYVISSNA